MDNITNVIAANLQAIRKERQMTLSDLADVTGVSKSMLGEIERGTSNPTITVLWKITTGLKISISHLIHAQAASCQMVKENDWRILHEDPANISMIFECDHTRNFEVYHMEFQPGSEHPSTSHDKGVVEYIMTYEGAFTIIVDANSFQVDKGDSLLFEADNPHSYRNDGDVVARGYSIIYYPQI
ncbi:DNA-binding protein [Deltaproteobacteria bacterium Smac51]|nr:DNA-binding protein [Deltaproteobacteria bacterium Smac51]